MSVPDDLGFEPVSKAVFFYFDIVSGLKIEPKPLARPKETGKPQGRVRGDVPLAMDHFVDAASRDIDALGQPVLADAHGLQELLQQDLARVDGGKLLLRHCLLS